MNRTALLQNPLPVDGTAARVVFGKGEHWAPLHKGPNEGWDAPPLPEAEMPKGATNIAGVRRGHITALRYHRTNQNNGPKWLVRCDCGRYELRRLKTWIKSTAFDECERCRSAHYAKHGFNRCKHD